MSLNSFKPEPSDFETILAQSDLERPCVIS